MKFCLRIILGLILLLSSQQVVLAQSENDVLFLQIKTKEEEIKKLETELNKHKSALQTTQFESKTLKSQILRIEARLKRLNVDLKITQAKISKTEFNIKLTSKQISEKDKKITERKTAMAKSLRFLAYSDDRGFIAAILKSKKLSEFFNQNEYLINAENGLYKDFKILAQEKMELKDLLEAQQALKSNLNGLKKELLVKNQLVQNQDKEKKELLSQTNNQEKEYQKLISRIQIRQAEIQKEIFDTEARLRGELGGIPKPRLGALAWPLLGRITQGYGPTSVTGFYNDSYKFHNGIDIAAYYGTPVRAALGGIVSASADDGRYAYGSWLSIRHEGGLTTLYTHLSAKAVYRGETVLQGQIIGYVGSSGFTTGPHLHFTVYSTNTFRAENHWYGLLPLGGSVNPLDYMLSLN